MLERNFKYDQRRMAELELMEFCAPFVHKFWWFAAHNYVPHYYQQLFHAMHSPDEKLLRYRHLVAGRRGGKTLSAAWELLYYCMNPEMLDVDHNRPREKQGSPPYAWVLFKDNPTGKASWDTFRFVLKEAGFTHGVEYKENRTNRWFEFANGAFVHFRTAEDPQSLRGAGLDIMWIDEASFIPSGEAWDVSSPALSDKEGMLITTTTPNGKNWFWEYFFSDVKRMEPDSGRVEYRSLDNPYFSKKEWEKQAASYHPMLFRQEFLAAFDAMAGRELSAEWLKYYTLGRQTDPDIPALEKEPGSTRYNLKLFMGVDPAISLADTADNFAMALLGVTQDNSQVYLLNLYKGKLPFPDQVEKIKEWHLRYRPMLVGIESNAYQAALAQQVQRLEGMVPVVPIISGQKKKMERILGMAPLFKIGRIRILKEHRDFIDEWLDYDSTVKNPKDDVLDAVEIALQTAGALLPELPKMSSFFDDRPLTLEELARADRPGGEGLKNKWGNFDEILGGDW